MKSILFFPINGSGLGHLNRCLAYARHMPRDWRSCFFSLCPILEPVEKMGFKADYFLSPFWTTNPNGVWNKELAMRLGLVLEHLAPNALVFDGTYPFNGLKWALNAYKRPIMLVWSRRGFIKKSDERLNERAELFDLEILPGELDADFTSMTPYAGDEAVIQTSPITLFDQDEILDGKTARARLNLPQDEKLVLFSIGSGNLKDISGIGRHMLARVREAGYRPVWLQSPLAIHPLELPPDVILLDLYPIAQCLKAFDGIVAAAGYNTCQEVAVTGIPALFAPNEKLVDDQLKRARLLEANNLAVICDGQSPKAMDKALAKFFELMKNGACKPLNFTNGAKIACEAIVTRHGYLFGN